MSKENKEIEMSLTTAEKEIINALYIYVNASGKLGEVLMDPVIVGVLSATQALDAMGSLLEKASAREIHEGYQQMVQVALLGGH